MSEQEKLIIKVQNVMRCADIGLGFFEGVKMSLTSNFDKKQKPTPEEIERATYDVVSYATGYLHKLIESVHLIEVGAEPGQPIAPPTPQPKAEQKERRPPPEPVLLRTPKLRRRKE